MVAEIELISLKEKDNSVESAKTTQTSYKQNPSKDSRTANAITISLTLETL